MGVTNFVCFRFFYLSLFIIFDCLLQSTSADRGGILQRILDLCFPQEDVTTAHPPQHPLKGWDPFPADHSSHKPAQIKHAIAQRR